MALRSRTSGPGTDPRAHQLMGPSSAGFMYSDNGGSGPPVEFLHGGLMNGTLWNDILDPLCNRYRCIVPELPFGAHRTPMSWWAEPSTASRQGAAERCSPRA